MDRIEHNGIVASIEGSHIRVNIVQHSACSSCKAKSLCMSSEQKEKIIDVYDADIDGLSVGDEVVVCGTLSMGKAAVRIAFAYPVVLIISTILLSRVLLDFSEGYSVLFALIALVLYGSVVYAMRNRLKRDFAFWIKRSSE